MFSSCDKDVDFNYSISINSPDISDKNLNDSIHLHVVFNSGTNETIHNVNVRIFNKFDNTEVYNEPNEVHIHQSGGSFEFHDDFLLSNENGVEAHTDWILEARVWDDEDSDSEHDVMEAIEFHVHPE